MDQTSLFWGVLVLRLVNFEVGEKTCPPPPQGYTIWLWLDFDPSLRSVGTLTFPLGVSKFPLTNGIFLQLGLHIRYKVFYG